MDRWECRRILLPLAYDRSTGHIMSTIFRSFPLGMDETQTYLKSEHFPNLPEEREVSETQIAQNIRFLDKFKNAMLVFTNENFLEDITDYEMDSYSDRYFYLTFRYLLESKEETVEVKGPPPREKLGVGETNSMFPANSPKFQYIRPEDIIAHELIYSLIPRVFGSHRILELVPLLLHEVPEGDGGKMIPSCGLDLVENPNQGLLVNNIHPNSPMKNRVFVGDMFLEIAGKPITSFQILHIYFRTGTMVLVQRAV